MMKIKAILIDDEPRARDLLRNMVGEHCPEVEIMESCPDLPNGVKAIRKLKPDLVFVDIEMPGHSGLELLDFFNEEEIDFAIVFTTAYQQYAINAIKISAFDYLLKPIEPAELIRSVEKLKKKLEQQQAREQHISLQANKIAVPTSNGVRFIDAAGIIYLKADNTYTEMHLLTGEKVLVSRTLKNFEEALQALPHFFRCSKSHMVNAHFVSEYVKSEGGYLVMQNKATLPIAADKVAHFLELSAQVKR